MDHQYSSPADFIDPAHQLSPNDRRGALISVFVPALGLLWLAGKSLGADAPARRVYTRFICLCRL